MICIGTKFDLKCLPPEDNEMNKSICFRTLVRLGLFVVVLIIMLPSSSSLSPRNQLTIWKGSVVTENGVLVVKNPLEPVYGEITLALKEELSIGSEEDEKTAFFQAIRFTVDELGNYFVADVGNNRVQKFDKNGKYLQTIGRSGQGPGEFNSPNSIFIDDNGTLYVLQQQGVRLSLFDRKGDFLKDITFRSQLYSCVRTRNGLFYGVTSDFASEASHDKVILFNVRGEQVKKLADFKNQYYLSMVGKRLIGAYQSFRPVLWCVGVTGDIVAFGFSGEYRIHVVNASGDHVRIIEKTGEPAPITEEEKDLVIENEIGIARRKGMTYAKSEVKKAYIFPSKRPFFQGIMSDDQGRIYVLKSLDYHKNKRPAYDLFDNMGRYIFRIIIPEPVLTQFIKNGCLYSIGIDKETGAIKAKKFRILNWNKIDIK